MKLSSEFVKSLFEMTPLGTDSPLRLPSITWATAGSRSCHSGRFHQLGVLVVGAFMTRVLLFGVYIRALIF